MSAPSASDLMAACRPGSAPVLLLHADAQALLARHADLAQLLSAPEREQLARFVAPQAALLHAAAHGLLRCALAAFLGQAPQAIALATQDHGKPCLAGNDGPAFNLSHAGGAVLVAIGGRAPLGVDIEPVGRTVDWRGVARMICGPQELARLESADATTFLRLWTRKEAIAKALGLGMSAPLRAIDGWPAGHGDWSALALPPPHGTAWVRELAGLPALHGHLACMGAAPAIELRTLA